ncbi:hypothetical protein GGX14DRAFT_557519 [Mycena pura]|uniref:Uncharacterized protein n=1 Tax=Mycena pura TaxID=153505 RepID=A0AAD7E2F7_9AGAR|nr:hypothetical protein GGX14DRAFT_557519 [Mycena pura]
MVRDEYAGGVDTQNRHRLRHRLRRHGQAHMQRGEWAESMSVIGIECVGVIGSYVRRQRSHLGRRYAEYTAARLANVVPVLAAAVVATLGWACLAALPETYATAWACMDVHGTTSTCASERVLVRGGGARGTHGRGGDGDGAQTGAGSGARRAGGAAGARCGADGDAGGRRMQVLVVYL